MQPAQCHPRPALRADRRSTYDNASLTELALALMRKGANGYWAMLDEGLTGARGSPPAPGDTAAQYEQLMAARRTTGAQSPANRDRRRPTAGLPRIQ